MNSLIKKRPLMGLTMGDASGIGPEIIIKQIMYEKNLKDKLIIFGAEEVFEYYLNMFNLAIPINVIENIDDIDKNYKDGEINIFQREKFDIKQLEIGKVCAYSGGWAFKCASDAIDAAIDKKIDAVVTAPLNKEAMNLAGFKYKGHTELLAEKTDTDKFVMMLAAKLFRVALVTTHVSIKEVPALITKERVIDVIRVVNGSLKEFFGIKNPKIAVSALNPHNSEGGIMGDEEEKEIIPAIEEAKKDGIDVHGSFAADTLFTPDKRREYDCFISMYHDQGLVALKSLYFDNSVNITMGIPIVRTSVDHGTAFDIVGKFKASHNSLNEAIKQAHRMVQWKLKNR